MRHQLRVLVGASVAALTLLAGTAAPSFAHDRSPSSGSQATGDKQPIFDFSDAYYRANGIDPAGIVGRRSGSDGLSVVAPAPDANHRNVRVTFVLPAYDTSGGKHFFTVLGDLAPTAFLPTRPARPRRSSPSQQRSTCSRP